jgi:hypothetical protein
VSKWCSQWFRFDRAAWDSIFLKRMIYYSASSFICLHVSQYAWKIWSQQTWNVNKLNDGDCKN